MGEFLRSRNQNTISHHANNLPHYVVTTDAIINIIKRQSQPPSSPSLRLSQPTLTSLLGDKDALTAVLARHVIAGSKILSGDIPQGVTKVQTLGGGEVEVIRRGSSVSIKSAAGSARVIKADVGATNGVIHVVDTVF